jgi:peptidoglycan DL-endopeptidase CwlO
VIKLKQRRILIIIIIIIISTFGNIFSGTVTSADNLTTKLNKQKAQLARDKATHEDILSEIDDENANIEKLDSKIIDQMDKIHATSGKIVLVNKKIALVKNNITKAEKAIKITAGNIDSEQIIYNKRLRVLYMNGTTGYLELILSSKNFVDFLERYQLMKSIIKFDTNLIQSLQNKKKSYEIQKKSIENQKAQLVIQKNNLLSLQNQNKIQLAQLKSTKEEENKLIISLVAQEKKYKKAIDEYNALINSTLKQIAEMRKRLKNSKGGKYSQDALVVYAANFLGTKYVWGGTTPRGFDCSGFTKYVFAHFGINLNRVSGDQAKQGTYVTKANLQPGDLVFFGSPIHHVGIYVGNNSFIHAPRTGDVVRITLLTRKDFRFGRRLK